MWQQLNRVDPKAASDSFKEVFFVVIQLGAILAVVLSAVLVLLFVLAVIYKKKVMLCNTKFEYILEYW